jgi:mannose-1-phosphate guanylyltransferase / mannose-6-phosphate isomerase
MGRDMPTTIQPIILAGGSGTRLWPASRQSHPKQLLALTGALTLLQETALRLREC